MNERAKHLVSRILSQVEDEPFEDVMSVFIHIHIFLIVDQADNPILTVDKLAALMRSQVRRVVDAGADRSHVH